MARKKTEAPENPEADDAYSFEDPIKRFLGKNVLIRSPGRDAYCYVATLAGATPTAIVLTDAAWINIGDNGASVLGSVTGPDEINSAFLAFRGEVMIDRPGGLEISAWPHALPTKAERSAE